MAGRKEGGITVTVEILSRGECEAIRAGKNQEVKSVTRNFKRDAEIWTSCARKKGNTACLPKGETGGNQRRPKEGPLSLEGR